MADFKRFEEWRGRIGFTQKDDPDKKFVRYAYAIGDTEAEVKELIKTRIGTLRGYEPNVVVNVAISHKVVTRTIMTVTEFEAGA